MSAVQSRLESSVVVCETIVEDLRAIEARSADDRVTVMNVSARFEELSRYLRDLLDGRRCPL